MARATFVKKARNDVPNSDIKAGESYWWWKFRYGGKHVSRTQPKASQLTQSAFLSQLYDIQERIENLTASEEGLSDVEDIISSLNELADECESNRDNMPESLQDSDTGQLLEERADACRSAADELEGIDLSDFTVEETEEECIDCDGTGKAEGDGGKDGEADCPTCDGTGKVDLDEPKNNDGETEEEYWQAKLEEVQNVSIDAS